MSRFYDDTLKPLEALIDLSQQHKISLNDGYRVKCYKVIETALKRLETLEEEKQSFDRAIEKKLKALEIIKENLVVGYDESENDMPCLVIGFKIDNDRMAIIYQTFDKEKIDLLKEVLL